MGIPPENESMQTARAVLVAGGTSKRMGTGERKPLLLLDEHTLIEHSVRAFEACRLVTSIVIVTHAEDLEALRSLLLERAKFPKLHALVVGGKERGDSVREGSRMELPGFFGPATEPPHHVLAIHDAARPFVTAEAVERVILAAARSGAALLALPMRDTIKSSDDGHLATHTVDRAPLWAAQTPQAFHAARFRAYQTRAFEEGFQATDDAALWEHFAGTVELVPGSALNFKVTDPDDLRIARAILADPSHLARRQET